LDHAGRPARAQSRGLFMNNIIYIVGLIVVVLAILSFLGLR
jgi:small-conductance mechanosensitive channel